jgi:putative acetyltransferase
MDDLAERLTIQPLQLHQLEEVKHLIFQVCSEIFQVTEEVIKRFDTMSDIDNVEADYFEQGGTFLVLIDDGRVVGCGAIRRWNSEICELKRMWLLPAYRGQGLGYQMVQILFEFAINMGYKTVRLDLFDAQKQAQALSFYRQLGFYAIAPYNDSPCTVFMEKML